MNSTLGIHGVDDKFNGAFIDTTSKPYQTIKQTSVIRPLGIGLIITLSSLTAIADPWATEVRGKTQPTTLISKKSISRQRVTRAEALRIVMEILENAEKERSLIAEKEANCGINWGE